MIPAATALMKSSNTDAADLNQMAGRKSRNLIEGPIVVVLLRRENVKLLA